LPRPPPCGGGSNVVSAWLRLGVGLALVAALFLIDVYVAPGRVDLPYALAILLALWWNSPNKTFVLALAATGASAAAMAIAVRGGMPDAGFRGLGIVAIWLAAIAVVLRQRWEARTRQGGMLATALL